MFILSIKIKLDYLMESISTILTNATYSNQLTKQTLKKKPLETLFQGMFVMLNNIFSVLLI